MQLRKPWLGRTRGERWSILGGAEEHEGALLAVIAVAALGCDRVIDRLIDGEWDGTSSGGPGASTSPT
jgi:hypothetical protein